MARTLNGFDMQIVHIVVFPKESEGKSTKSLRDLIQGYVEGKG